MKKINDAAPKGIIFDLDGTLLDSLKDIALSMNEVLVNMGLNPHPISDYRYFVGSGVRELLNRALPEELLTDEMIVEFTDSFRELYSRQWVENTCPYPGILNLLDSLVQNQVLLGVLSNKPHDFTCRMVESCFPKPYFAAVMGARENVPIKPHPESALQIAEQWNISPEKILFVGDTSVDMETARNAGMIGVGVSWGFRTVEELLESGARTILDHPKDLLKDFFAAERSSC